MRTVALALAFLSVVSLPRSASASASEASATEERAGKKRHTRLAVGVGVSAGAVIIGALTLAIPMVSWGCDAGEFCDGTPLVVPMAIGSTFMVAGGIATAATGAALGHHQSWHRAARDTDVARAHAARRTRGLKIGVGVSAGLFGLGAATIGAGLGAARSCGSDDCETAAVLTGVTLGPTLMIGGALSLVATATLLGLHRSHRHDRATARVRVQPVAGGMLIRF